MQVAIKTWATTEDRLMLKATIVQISRNSSILIICSAEYTYTHTKKRNANLFCVPVEGVSSTL